MKLGDTVYVVDQNARQGTDQTPKPTEVTRVGRKYFELKGYWSTKFSLETMRDVSWNSNSTYRVYRTIQAIAAEREQAELYTKVYRYFTAYGNKKPPLDTLREICVLLEIV